jgi:hypothetical protein
VQITATSFTRPQAAGMHTPPAPKSTVEPRDQTDFSAATLAAGAVTGGVSAILCGAGALGAAALGLPFVGPVGLAAAIGGSALFGAALTAATLKNSVALPADVDEKFALGRQGIFRNLPFPVRDAASMSLAENQIWAALDSAPQSTYRQEAAEKVGEASVRLGEILGHGAARTTSLVMGVALATAATGSVLVGAPLGLVAGFAASYALDPVGHWLGEKVGRKAGELAGAQAWDAVRR